MQKRDELLNENLPADLEWDGQTFETVEELLKELNKPLPDEGCECDLCGDVCDCPGCPGCNCQNF